jgi:hypothetical protein
MWCDDVDDCDGAAMMMMEMVRYSNAAVASEKMK